MGKETAKNLDRAAERAYLSAAGFSGADIEKPLIAVIASSGAVAPYVSGLNATVEAVKEGVIISGGQAVFFSAPVCGISGGLESAPYSLAARELIADCVEMTLKNNPADGAVLIPSDDMSYAGMLMGALRVNIPVLVCGGGPARPETRGGVRLGLSDVYETMGKALTGKTSAAELSATEKVALTSTGAPTGLYAPFSFAALAEALGAAPFGNGTIAASSAERKRFAKTAGVAVMSLVEKNITLKKIIDLAALKNAAAVSFALGGNTTNLLHLLALAHELNIRLTTDDLHKIAGLTPVLCRLAPQGDTYLNDLYEAGGIAAVLNELNKIPLLVSLKGTTANGKTFAENISGFEADGKIIKTAEDPYAKSATVVKLTGSLAEGGCFAQAPLNFANTKFTGAARVFDNIPDAATAIKHKQVKAGECLVIRYIGPRGAPGMREVTLPFAMLYGAGLAETVPVITDGLITDGARGIAVGHITPEAAEGDTLALIENGDKIEIDFGKAKINVFLSAKDLGARRKKWRPKDVAAQGYLLRYSAAVSPAPHGAVLKK